MTGLDAVSGRAMAGRDHLAQSIADILLTPIGTRVMRRDYGSALFELLDGPINALTRLRLFAAVAQALARWEPRLRLTRVGIASADADGTLTLALEGKLLDRARPTDLVRLSIPLQPA